MDKSRFVAIRKDKGFTQATLAEALKVSPGYIGDIERGHREVSLTIAKRLEEVTGVPVLAEFIASRVQAA